MFLVCDLDGTLADDRGRRHLLYDTAGAPWTGDRRKDALAAYHSRAFEDVPRLPLLYVLEDLSTQGWRVELWTARSAAYRELTRRWLDRIRTPGRDPLLLRMRPIGDTADSRDLKTRWAREKGNWPDMVIDDRRKCVDHWRSMGILCLQVEDVI
jgi:hypothetical protein